MQKQFLLEALTSDTLVGSRGAFSLHCMAYLEYHSTHYCIFIKFALCLRYEHTKPAKQDEVPSSKPSVPLTAAPLAGTPDPVSDGPGGTSDAQEKPQGSGAVDWVNAAEFVPGQPYCGRGECSRERCSVVTAKTICENTVPADKQSIRCTI